MVSLAGSTGGAQVETAREQPRCQHPCESSVRCQEGGGETRCDFARRKVAVSAGFLGPILQPLVLAGLRTQGLTA